MKKKLLAAVTLVAAIALITIMTVYANVIRSEEISRLMDMGYTEDEAIGARIIKQLSNTKSYEAILGTYDKYDESWEEVTKEYNVDFDEFSARFMNEKEIEQLMSIPESIYSEMRAEGMSDAECRRFILNSHNAEIDITKSWTAHKSGKTIGELAKEAAAVKNELLQIATDFTFGKINIKECTARMKTISPEMTTDEIVRFAETEKSQWMESVKTKCGITDAEIAIAQKSGMTNFFEICNLKEMEKVSNITFEEMVAKVKSGVKVRDVIKNNLSETKIKNLQQASETVKN